MRSIKKLLAVVLAAALTLGTMSVAFAGSENPIKAFSEPLNAGTTAVGVSSVSIITDSSNSVAKGSTKQLTARVMSGDKDVTGTVSVDWSVDSRTSTINKTTGLLTVPKDEGANYLTVTATCNGVATTVTLTVTDPSHVHTTDCLVLQVYYNNNYTGPDAVSMDISETSPKSDYFDINVYCNKSVLVPADTKVTMAIIGDEYKDVLSVSYAKASTSSGIRYAGRFVLNDGKKISGSHIIPLEITIGDAKFSTEIGLYAEAQDPMYYNEGDAAVFTVDLNDIKSEYTSTILPIVIPGGVRSFSTVEFADEYTKKRFDIKLVGDGLQLTAKADQDGYLQIGNYPEKVKLTLNPKARVAPIVFDIPINVNYTNSEAVELEYEKELVIPGKEKTEIVVNFTKDLADSVSSFYISDVITKSDDNEPVGVEYGRNNTVSMVAEREGSATFDVEILLGINDVVSKDGKITLSGSGVITKKDNPIKVTDNKNESYIRYSYEGLFDINDPATYTKEVKISSYDGKVENITVDEMLFSKYQNRLEGSVSDYFTVDTGTTAEDGSRILTVTLKNEPTVKLDEYAATLIVKVKLEGSDNVYSRELHFEFFADAPTTKAYTYDTEKEIASDTIAVGSSKKFNIKASGRTDAINSVLVYTGDAFEVVRGSKFLSDMTSVETITVNARKEVPTDDWDDLCSMVFYTPKVTNEAVKISVSGEWNISQDLVRLNTSGKPVDPEDPNKPVDPEDPNKPVDPSTPGGGGGSTGGGSNNEANKPETGDKIKDTVDAVKGVATINPDKLPAGVTVGKTADGSSIATIPLKLTSGSANMSTDIFNTLGAANSKVGLELTVSAGFTSKDSVKIIIPGGFGKITEPGRISFPMDYKPKSPDADIMLKAVKGEGAVSFTAQIGGNFNLPVAATITIKSTAPEGSTVNIYKYDPITRKFISIGKAKVVGGTLTFATKAMGQMLFTTGTI